MLSRFVIAFLPRSKCLLISWLQSPSAVILHIMPNVRQNEAQAGIKIVRRNINNLRYADNTTLIPENKEELKSLLMKLKKESEKAGLKLSIQKTKIMTSSPITSWQIDVEKVKTEILFSWAPKSLQMVTTAMKIRHLLLGRKALTNLASYYKAESLC